MSDRVLSSASVNLGVVFLAMVAVYHTTPDLSPLEVAVVVEEHLVPLPLLVCQEQGPTGTRDVAEDDGEACLGDEALVVPEHRPRMVVAAAELFDLFRRPPILVVLGESLGSLWKALDELGSREVSPTPLLGPGVLLGVTLGTGLCHDPSLPHHP